MRLPRTSTLFPYTTLFRSGRQRIRGQRRLRQVGLHQGARDARAQVNHAAKDLVDRPDQIRGRRSEEHTSELQSHSDLVCRLLLEKKKWISPRQALSRSADA